MIMSDEYIRVDSSLGYDFEINPISTSDICDGAIYNVVYLLLLMYW